MKFTELQKILEDKLGIIRLADIARELDVTPQVVSNWKSRDQVPYKNVKKLREKIRSLKTHDNYIENLLNQDSNLNVYGWDSNMCYGTKKHINGIKENGLSKYHRKSFGICKDYLNK